MPVSRTIGPLTATLERDELVFRFHDPLTMALEVPATLEYDLNQFIEEHKESLSGCQLLVDLQGVTGINSRQLGVMLALRQVLAAQGSLALRGLSQGVKRLLAMTRMEHFFHAVP